MNTKLENWFPTSKIPESNRIIKIEGCDWSHFTMLGVFIDYKKPIKIKKGKFKKSRFCRLNEDGKFDIGNPMASLKDWLDADSWTYVE